jgi:hypothetical protein
LRIAQQRVPKNFERAAELKRQACGHRSVTRIGVALAAWFVILQKQFANLAVGKSADRAGIGKTGDLDIEALGEAAVAKAPASGHGRASSWGGPTSKARRRSATGSVPPLASSAVRSARTTNSTEIPPESIASTMSAIGVAAGAEVTAKVWAPCAS